MSGAVAPLTTGVDADVAREPRSGLGPSQCGWRSTTAGSPRRCARPHTEVRFVLVNRDPIRHELIVGDDQLHAPP